MLHLRLTDYIRRRSLFAILRQSKASYPPHTQDFHELMHVTGGGGTHVLNGQSYEFAPGQTWYVGPDDVHSLHPGREGLTWINVAFADHRWQAFREMMGAEAPPVLTEGRARAPFDAALVAFHVDNTPWALATFLIATLAPRAEVVNGPTWLLRAVACLDDPEELRRGVPALLDAACVSASHLARSVRAAYGVSPTELVNTARLERASILLTSTTDSVHEIALDCGFDSLSYFYRCFRGRFGSTPHGYRTGTRLGP